jgi:hypothetical protein
VIAVVALAACAAAVTWTLSLRGSSASSELAGQADQLCDDYHRAVAGLGKPSSRAAVPAFAAREKPLARTLVQELERLVPPANEARDYARFLALVKRQIVLLDTQSTAAKANDSRAFDRAAIASHSVRAAERRLGKRLRFFVCGR